MNNSKRIFDEKLNIPAIDRRHNEWAVLKEKVADLELQLQNALTYIAILESQCNISSSKKL